MSTNIAQEIKEEIWRVQSEFQTMREKFDAAMIAFATDLTAARDELNAANGAVDNWRMNTEKAELENVRLTALCAEIVASHDKAVLEFRKVDAANAALRKALADAKDEVDRLLDCCALEASSRSFEVIALRMEVERLTNQAQLDPLVAKAHLDLRASNAKEQP